MDADDRTWEQASELFDQIQSMLLHLVRLQNRMADCGFPDDDQLLTLVLDARATIYELRQEFHRRTASGIMRMLRDGR